MTHAARLIDAAKEHGGFPTYTALAHAIGVTKGTLSAWRGGHGSPMTEERVMELCKLAGETDCGPWLLGIHTDAVHNKAARRALESLLDRLRAAAVVLAVALVLSPMARAYPAGSQAERGEGLYIMRSVLRRLLARTRANWAAARSICGPSALLA